MLKHKKIIGILGAQGHFGQCLSTHLAEMKGDAAIIIPTVDKNSNREIASRADIVLITVRPDQVESVLREVSGHLKPTARIVSFAARYPLTSILRITKRPAARVMADPDWNLSAFVLSEGFSEEDFRSEFAGLTRTEPVRLQNDFEMNTFSVLLTHLLVVSVLKRQGTLPNFAYHFTFIGKKLEIPTEELQEFQTEGDPSHVLKTATTPGGITEMTLLLLRENPAVTPEQLHNILISQFVSTAAY